MKLRDYQLEAVDSSLEILNKGGSTLGVAATGLGKTIIFASVAKQMQHRGRVMVIAHREELIRQAAGKIMSITGEKADIEMASERADLGEWFRSPVIVASKDTLVHRLDKFDPRDFGLIITDEAHHAVAMRYRRIFDHFKTGNPDIAHLGVTATPDRADEEALGQVYNTVAFDYDVLYGISNGWLVDVHQHSVIVESLDYSKIKTTAGELNGRELSEELERYENLHQMVTPIIELAQGRRTLVFAASVAHAEKLSEIINRHEPDQARWVCGKTPKPERAAMLRDYTAGKFRYLVNVGVFTEGFDEPGIQVVALARATKSRSLYAQMIGRGTRVLPGVIDHLRNDPVFRRHAIRASEKPRLDVLDFEGNAGHHKLITSADILGGNHTEEVIAEAKAISRKESGDVRQALSEAEKVIAHRKRQAAAHEEAKQRASLKVKTRYSATKVDPFDVFDMVPPRPSAMRGGVLPTERQADMLKRNGIECNGGMTRQKASTLISEIIGRREKGQASYKQCKVLRKYDYDTSNMTFPEANKLISQIEANGWRRPA